MKFASVKGRADRLERALGLTMKSFTKFQDLAMTVNELPPKVALALSKAAMEMASYSKEVRLESMQDVERVNATASLVDKLSEESSESHSEDHSEDGSPPKLQGRYPDQDSSNSGSSPEPGNSIIQTVANHTGYSTPLMNRFDTTISAQPSSPLFPWTSSLHNLTFTQRLRLSCIERGLQYLSIPTATIYTLHPSLSLHLFSYPYISIQHLRILAEATLFGLTRAQPTSYGPCPAILTPMNLEMFRSIAGVRIIGEQKLPILYGFPSQDEYICMLLRH
jgi:hypothetical protein